MQKHLFDHGGNTPQKPFFLFPTCLIVEMVFLTQNKYMDYNGYGDQACHLYMMSPMTKHNCMQKDCLITGGGAHLKTLFFYLINV